MLSWRLQRSREISLLMQTDCQHHKRNLRDKSRKCLMRKKRRAKFKGRCFRCGSGDHMVPQCKLPSNITCNSCKQSGHVSAVCERASTVRATIVDNPADPNQLQLQYLPGPPAHPAASSFYIPQQGYQNFNPPSSLFAVFIFLTLGLPSVMGLRQVQ